MDKLEILLDMIEHPERYTEQHINELLADEEMRNHYDVMVRLREAYDVKKLKSEKYILLEESDASHKGHSHFSLLTLSHCRHLPRRRLPRWAGLRCLPHPFSSDQFASASRGIRSLPNREGGGRVFPYPLLRHPPR